MKKAIAFCLLFAQISMAFGQTNPETVFYTNKEMRYLFYLEQRGQTVTLFRLGKHMDKAGIGPSILYTDTLTQAPTGSEWLWTNQKAKIKQSNGQLTLHFWDDRRSKAKTINLHPVADTQLVHTTLNHAYWLDHFFAMSRAVNDSFPLLDFSFRDGFGQWNWLYFQNLPYPTFRTYADDEIKATQVAFTSIHKPLSATTNAIINHIATIDYAVLKEGLSALKPTHNYPSRYFATVIRAVANNRPDFYFQLAEDLPNKQADIFNAVYEKKIIKKLKAFPTDSPAKKAFIKNKKGNRNILVGSAVAVTASAALIGVIVYALSR